MKVTAYLTTCCGTLQNEEDVYGVINVPDLFTKVNDFKTVKPDKANIHYCTHCYLMRVTEAAKEWLYKEETVREKDIIYKRKVKSTSQEQQAKLQELAYVFKKSLFNINELTIM